MTQNRDWREVKAVAQARWLYANCRRCFHETNDNRTCGAWICGDENWDKHRTWHQTIDERLDRYRDRLKTLEETTIPSLEARITALEILP